MIRSIPTTRGQPVDPRVGPGFSGFGSGLTVSYPDPDPCPSLDLRKATKLVYPATNPFFFDASNAFPSTDQPTLCVFGYFKLQHPELSANACAALAGLSTSSPQHPGFRFVRRIYGVVFKLNIPPQLYERSRWPRKPPNVTAVVIPSAYSPKTCFFVYFKLQHQQLRCVLGICDVVLHLTILPMRANGCLRLVAINTSSRPPCVASPDGDAQS
ncbi:hypothetical protein B0H10DRAFT_2225125 [Mycena sp. CBHHK59/15]|nr:hypothetical protein B0H10DRAFT_2225125 [Mycena sp. CBHHK59/15]